MKFHPLPLILLATTLSAAPGPIWESLFNGQDLTGWKVVDGIAPVLVDDGCIVAITQDKDAFPYLIAEEKVSDFILELEVKVIGDLNSGILLRGLSDPAFRDGRPILRQDS